jgi:hypothetical protein
MSKTSINHQPQSCTWSGWPPPVPPGRRHRAAKSGTVRTGIPADRAGLGFAPGGLAADDLRISLNRTREFGMVLSAGLGGLDAELDEGNFRRDRASVYAAAELTDADDFLALFKRTIAWQRIAAQAARAGKTPPEAALRACFDGLLALAAGPWGADSDALLPQHLELNPVCATDTIAVGAARCEFAPAPPRRLPRPTDKIAKLIHPKSIGIIGVSSTSMNFGRIILKNLMGSGYPKDQLCIIRPGETEIDGVRCVEGLKALDGKLDLSDRGGGRQRGI